MDHEPECYVFNGDCCPWVTPSPCNCQCICDILKAAYKRGYEDGYEHGDIYYDELDY